MAIVRNGLFAIIIVMMCYYLFKSHDAMTVFKSFSPVFQVSSNSRVCLDPSEPDYFQALSKSTGVNASKKNRTVFTAFVGSFIYRAQAISTLASFLFSYQMLPDA